jgi:glycosyltransferase involved in cell wall biosynthesis
MPARKLKTDPLNAAAAPAPVRAPATPTPAPSADGLERRSRHGRRLSVIAPAYNEEDVLAFFFLRMERVLNACALDWEIICVNDGSRDSTMAVLLHEHQRNPRVKIIDLSRNFGKEIALSAGMDAATGDMILPMDVDLQDPPEIIPEFIAQWEAGYDVVYGVRASRDEDGLAKRVSARGFYRLFNLLAEIDMPQDAGDFRLMDRSVVEVLKALPERNRFMKGLFAWVGFRQVGVPFARPPRAAGQTSWRYWRLWNFALDGLTAFSTVPLRLWTYVGGGVALAAFGYAGFLVIDTLVNGRDVPGYASLMVAVLMSLGLNMLALGIIGEYLGRIFQEVKRRPLYVTRRAYGLEPDI